MKRTTSLGALLTACVLLVAVAGGSASAQPRATTPATISATPSPSQIVVNTKTAVTGRVTPAKATPTVVLQRKVDGRWLDRGSAKVDRTTGAYRLPAQPSQTGSYSLRVRSAGGGVVSRTVFIQVWASKQVLSSGGNFTSSRIPFTGGTYNVVFTAAAGCSYHATLFQTAGVLANNFPLAAFAGQSTKMDLGIPRASYTLKVETGAAPKCPWTATFYRR